jgi:excisionase family DNA binding protein
MHMNTLSITSPFDTRIAQDHREASTTDPYATEAQSAAVQKSGAQYRRDRMDAADMITTDEAAQLVGTSRVTINAWIKTGRCIGVANLRRGFKLPRWQFEPSIAPLLQPLAKGLGNCDGWQLLSFLETPSMALDGQTPRAALEQGVPGERILALATAEAH